MEKTITLKYLDKLSDKVWETIQRENLDRYSDRRIYLDSILDSIDKVYAVIKKGEYDGEDK